MSGRVIIMLVIGLGLMGLMWAKEWEHQGEKTRAATPIIGCAHGKGCPKENPLCLEHPAIPKGVCSSKCTEASQCPEGWCCHDTDGKGSKLRCAPPEICRRTSGP